MKLLMTTSVARQLNWKGVGGKPGFCKFHLKTIIFEAVHRNPSGVRATDASLEKDVQRRVTGMADGRNGTRKTCRAKEKESERTAQVVLEIRRPRNN